MECLKKHIMAVLEWLVRLLNLSFDVRVVPMDFRGTCIVPLYKGKGDKCKCSNSRGISLLRVVGKLCGRVVIKRVSARTECSIGEEQWGATKMSLRPLRYTKMGGHNISNSL